MVKKTLVAAAAISLSTFALSSCGSSSGADSGSDSGSDDGKITMGFAQVGAESGWRTANTKSIQETAAAEGIDLKFTDAQGKQENQIQAIRSYIQQKVDVIAFSPVVETGWDSVLQEAKYAVVGISPDTPAKLARFAEKEALTFPLVSDESKEVLTAYGAYGEKKSYGRTVMGVIRSTFVVDEAGLVEVAQYNVKATGHVAKLRKDLGLAS